MRFVIWYSRGLRSGTVRSFRKGGMWSGRFFSFAMQKSWTPISIREIFCLSILQMIPTTNTPFRVSPSPSFSFPVSRQPQALLPRTVFKTFFQPFLLLHFFCEFPLLEFADPFHHPLISRMLFGFGRVEIVGNEFLLRWRSTRNPRIVVLLWVLQSFHLSDFFGRFRFSSLFRTGRNSRGRGGGARAQMHCRRGFESPCRWIHNQISSHFFPLLGYRLELRYRLDQWNQTYFEYWDFNFINFWNNSLKSHF